MSPAQLLLVVDRCTTLLLAAGLPSEVSDFLHRFADLIGARLQ